MDRDPLRLRYLPESFSPWYMRAGLCCYFIAALPYGVDGLQSNRFVSALNIMVVADVGSRVEARGGFDEKKATAS